MTAVTNLALDWSKTAMKRSLFSRSLSVCSSLDSIKVAALDAHPAVLHSYWLPRAFRAKNWSHVDGKMIW
jgi:hypothetical protein